MPITIGCLRKGFLLFHLVTTLGLLASNVRAGLTVPVAQVKAVSGENDAGSGTSDVCNINDCQSIPCNLRRFTFYTQKTGALIKLHSKTNNGELTVCGWSVKDDAMYTLVQVSKVKGQSINGVNKPRIPFKVAWNKIKEVDQYWIGKNEFIKLASNSNVLLDFQVKRLNSTNIDVYCLFTNVRITEENELTSENTNCSHSRDLVYNNLYESNNDNKSKAFCDDIYNSIVNVSNSDAFLSCIIKLLNSVIIDEGESSRVTYTSVIVIGQEKKCDSIVECGKPKQCVYKSNKIGMACECPMKLCDVGMYVKQSNCKCVCNEEGNACSEHEEIDKEKSNNYTVILTFVIAILVMFTLIIFIVKAKKTINNQTLIEDIEYKLARINQLYTEVFWKAELASVVTGDRSGVGIIRKKRGAIGDECQYLLNYQTPRSMIEKGIGLSANNRKKKDEFCCDLQEAECISHLAVCDGIKDCSNGKDELFSVCSTPMDSNMRYVGRKFYNHCYDGFQTNEDIILIITDVSQKAYFTNQKKVSAKFQVKTIEKTITSLVSYDAQGFYNFAKRELVISSKQMDSARLLFSARFFGSTWSDWFVGRLLHSVTGRICAEYRFVREVVNFNILVKSDIGHFFVEKHDNVTISEETLHESDAYSDIFNGIG